MSKVDLLCNRVEPFAALFWALGTVLAGNWPCPPAHGITPLPYSQRVLMYGHGWFSSQQRRVAPHPPFLSRAPYIIYIYHTPWMGKIGAEKPCKGDPPALTSPIISFRWFFYWPHICFFVIKRITTNNCCQNWSRALHRRRIYTEEKAKVVLLFGGRNLFNYNLYTFFKPATWGNVFLAF